MTSEESKKLLEEFTSITTLNDVCSFFGLTYDELTFFLYRQPGHRRYFKFKISKKGGGFREICTPNHHLMAIHGKLLEPLKLLLKPKICAHGFINDRNIISNAKQHLRKRVIINIDLLDFFGSINFGRIRGLFMTKPFNFSPEIATIFAQLTCYDNKLPQGASTSPALSNFICHRLDNELLRFCLKNRLTYTRYADDITFSTNLKTIPVDVGLVNDNKLILSDSLRKLIDSNGFKINEKKVRYDYKCNRQEVTGLVVNRTLNIKRKFYNQVHSIIWLWEKFGVSEAVKIYASRPNLNWKSRRISPGAFVNHVIGKVEFVGQVRGKGDEKYQKLYKRVKTLEPGARLSIIQDELKRTTTPVILTEGKTDWKHLAAALRRLKAAGLYQNLHLKFQDYLEEKNMSNSELLKVCQGNSSINPSGKKLICIFDRDDKNTTARVTSTQEPFKNWGNNVYSLVLPVPPHRDFENICIEHYYTDEEIKIYDNNNRRLFLSSEFKQDGQHFAGLYSSNSKHVGSRFPTIIDSSVYDSKGESVALSKNQFSKYILEGKENFKEFNIEAFKVLFDTIEQICTIPDVPIAEALSLSEIV